MKLQYGFLCKRVQLAAAAAHVGGRSGVPRDVVVRAQNWIRLEKYSTLQDRMLVGACVRA